MQWMVLRSGITVPDAAPTTANDGVAVPSGLYPKKDGITNVGVIRVALTTYTSGTPAFSAKTYGYFPASGAVPAAWAPLGTNSLGVAALRGALNNGNSIGPEDGGGALNFVEQMFGFGLADRIYVRCTALVGGTYAVLLGAEDLARE